MVGAIRIDLQMRYQRRILRFSALFMFTLLTACSTTAGSIPGTEPVPSSLIRGRAFHAPDGSFTVEAPSTEWRWLKFPVAERASKLDGYVVVQFLLYRQIPITVFHFGVSYLGEAFSPNEEFMKGIQQGLEEGAAIKGLQVNDFVYEKADIPIEGASYRYTYKAVQGETITYYFGYIGGAQPKYHFQYADLEDREFPLFTAFVSSFRLTPKWPRLPEHP